MLKKYLSAIIFIFVFLLFETAILSNLHFLPVIPDFLMIITLYLSLHNGQIYGQSTGFVSGLMLDFFSMAPLGYNSLLRTILGFIFGLFQGVLNTSSILLQILYGIVATICKVIIIWVISLFFNGIISYSLFSYTFITEVILNAIFTPIMFAFLSLFSDFLLLDPERQR